MRMIIIINNQVRTRECSRRGDGEEDLELGDKAEIGQLPLLLQLVLSLSSCSAELSYFATELLNYYIYSSHTVPLDTLLWSSKVHGILLLNLSMNTYYDQELRIPTRDSGYGCVI